jgi:hypothetical protein
LLVRRGHEPIFRSTEEAANVPVSDGELEHALDSYDKADATEKAKYLFR